MKAEEIRLALEIMDMEAEKIGVLLDELADTCMCCGRRTKEGTDAGCVPCVARDVMTS